MKVVGKIMIFVFSLAFTADRVFAQPPPIKPPIGRDATVQSVLDNATNFLFRISFPIATLMLIIGAFYLVTASGNENYVKKGKDILLYTVVGLFVIVLARGVVLYIQKEFGN